MLPTFESISADQTLTMNQILVRKVKSVKFHPCSPNHVCILSDHFSIYDLGANLDDPVYKKSLPVPLEDFCFDKNDHAFDLAQFAIFFVALDKAIYVLSPVTFEGMEYNTSLFTLY